MEFPHINDTQFPHLDNVDVYKYKNNFDYARWQGKATYKLLNVKWNSTYNDVPYFDSINKRDEWFNSQESKIGILESVFNNTPKQKLKVPLPFNDMYHYNYIVIDMPIQTSEEQPLNYGDESLRVKRWFYFIEDMQQFAPSTTELEIFIDYWTTFIHSVSIPYLMLERGHAPMFETTVEKFLSNPIMNNEYLLADDFNYSDDTIVQTSAYLPIGNGEKYVLFCAPYDKDDFDQFGGTAYEGNSTPPTYSDINNRWGHQLQVNDYEWKYGNSDYSNSKTPITNQIQTGIFNGCECFAIEASEARAFFNDCARNCVNFIHGIQAMFILAENLFTRTTSFTFRGHTLFIADRKINNVSLTLSKEQFGFPTKYNKITKLYTFPYSQLEITDDEGNSFIAKIENTGRINMRAEVSLVYPFLNYNVFFTGINGDTSMSYIWKNVQGTNDSENIWADDFSKFMMNWKIPVYAIYASAEAEYAANNFFGNKAKRAGAIKDYENAVRSANTQRANTADSYATNTSNVAASGATLVTNTDNTTDAMVTNVAADMSTLQTNTTDASDTADDIRIKRSTTQTNIVNRQNSKIDTDTAIANSCVLQTTSTRNDYAATAYGNTGAMQIQNAGVGAIGSFGTGLFGGGLTGMAAGGISGVVSITQTGNSVLANGANVIAAIGTDAAIANLSTLCNDAYATEAKSANEYTRDQSIILDAYTVDETRALTVRQNNRVAATNNADAGRTKTAQDTNANNTRNTDNANATRTQNTETANAGYTRDAIVAAEKANLVQKQLEVRNTYRNARLHEPYKRGEYSGDYFADVYHRRGVRFNVRTQSKSAIAQTGDAMLRFGYALHKVWDMSRGFHYGKQFTFWKAEDIWINDGTGAANIATNAIANILLSGVTVWRDASKIGTIGIYDNI